MSFGSWFPGISIIYPLRILEESNKKIDVKHLKQGTRHVSVVPATEKADERRLLASRSLSLSWATQGKSH